VTEILCRKLRLREIYVGPNFAFGHRREGSFNLLKELGEQLGFHVGKIHQVQFRGARVSSTAVRQALVAGQAAFARRLLARPFALEGEIVHGSGIGSRMGIPTANLRADNELIPRSGVYVTLLESGGVSRPGVTNIGCRPTVSGGDAPLSIETHVLDYSGDLYGARVNLDFLIRLRDERPFPGVDSLMKQIHTDMERARRYLRWRQRIHAGSAN
jgi:riboflavin kinase/FMN adenylyltransferase